MKNVLLTIALLSTSAIANPLSSSEGITSLVVIQKIRQSRIARSIDKEVRQNRVAPTIDKVVRQNRIAPTIDKVVRKNRKERVARILLYKAPILSKSTTTKELIASR